VTIVGVRGRILGVLLGVVLLGACGGLSTPAPAPPPPPDTAAKTATSQPAPTTPTRSAPTTTTTPPPTPTTPTTSTPISGSAYGPRLAGEPQLGVQVHAAWSTMTPSQLNTIYGDLAAAGVQWVRIDLGWASFEGSGPGQISSSYTQIADNAVNSARTHGLQVLAMLWSSPGWANGGQGTNVAPTNPSDYANFARWAAQHFAGRVAAWEVWNEENNPSIWAGTDPAAYTALAKAAYPAIKAGDPSTTVVLGGTSYNDTAYLSALYTDGIRGSFDVLSTHPYQGVANAAPETPDNGTEWTLAHVGAVHGVMVANGDGNKPIWFTEFGWSNHTNAAGTPNWQLGVTDPQQGDYLVRTLRWLASNAPYVTRAFWYEAVDETNTDIQNANYGLLTSGLTPKVVDTTVSGYLKP
jgi:hypothetical protein